MRRFPFPVSSARGRVEAASINLIEVATRRGLAQISMETPRRLLRAYFGERWRPLDEMDEAMLVEAAGYLERLALEFRPGFIEPSLLKRGGALMLFVLGLAFVDSAHMPAMAKKLRASATAGHALQVR